MKRYAVWLVLLVAFVLAGCAGGSTTSAPAGEIVVTDESMGMKNILLIGLYRLEEAGQPLTAEQGEALATLWQAYKGVAATTASTTEETEALLGQMEDTLTDEQIAAINGMQLGSKDLAPFYTDLGIEMPTPAPGATAAAPGSGAGKNLTEEEKAARRAAMGDAAGSGSTRTTQVIDALIAYLQAID